MRINTVRTQVLAVQARGAWRRSTQCINSQGELRPCWHPSEVSLQHGLQSQPFEFCLSKQYSPTPCRVMQAHSPPDRAWVIGSAA